MERGPLSPGDLDLGDFPLPPVSPASPGSPASPTPPAVRDAPLPADIDVRPAAQVPFDLEAPLPLPSQVGLFATDLDGTLLSSGLTVGATALRAIRDAGAVGLEFAFVTGRPPRWLIPVIEATGHDGYAVCANGALVIDLAHERLVKAHPIETGLAVEVVTRLRELVPGISFAIERILLSSGAGPVDLAAASAQGLRGMTTVGYEPAYDPPWAPLPGTERGDILELIQRGPTIKLLGTPPAEAEHDADSLLALAVSEFADQLHLTHSGTREVIVEIMSGEVNKGVGLAEVASRLGVAQQAVVAVGDMPNDIAMLRWAGTSYAVANAHPLVRAAADHLVASNDDDGVGRLLAAIVAVRRGTT
ncbi:MAG: HAD family hydrolase [Candidatus Nanopelagicales bacterium]